MERHEPAAIARRRGVLYLALLSAFPEPRAAYGPEGARLVRTVDTPVPPITSTGRN
jgi:hypothetical protein